VEVARSIQAWLVVQSALERCPTQQSITVSAAQTPLNLSVHTAATEGACGVQLGWGAVDLLLGQR
jgi:hypothetical protein